MSAPEPVKIARGQSLDLTETVRILIEQGYQRVAKVSDPGEIAVRGGIIDVFPEGFEAPVRIEWHGDTVAALRSVHPFTGRPFLNHEIVLLLPAAGLARRPVRTSVKHLFLGEDAPLDPFVDIHVGDLAVHVVHGIGRYLGLKKVRSAGKIESHLVLEYAEEDRLYVPLSELNLVQKYLGFEGRPPKLSRLGTRYWARSKESAREGAASVAAELLRLEAKRVSVPGHAFKPDTEWQKELEKAFPHKETAGQARAVEEVKRDMESPVPMDRLLCGDVGYGKTEVALRAAFKAVMDGKQVVLLCPTTILAEQHHDTFRERMKAYPVSVGMLSRFQSDVEEKRILKGLSGGGVDIVIGTHRLFSPDVKFKDLGLVIVDEEQRFGVRHKEKLKRLRTQVDVLTLTATPIPRTLYQALVGARQMSVIDTPPFERLPVTTTVSPENPGIIREHLEREIKRQGQVFVIYPWIDGITKVHRRITGLVPEARIAVAHGQMPSRALEKAMLGFMHRETDILISTAIVESGIDIPNANTIIVYRSDAFGLADLYQLRGRVGRFTRQAHALFLTNVGVPLSADARKRLQALKEFSHLGAGFQVALQDLQLRGAGNLLGTEQHGHILTIGFDLYCRLLRGEIDRLKRK
ncbi:MAG: DEAD/DEAH box helicase [Candidatus Omnitrophica bacterium]|nr:DEAD/DEAH box helicase [Candidatus Omnitrophota bacterium]